MNCLILARSSLGVGVGIGGIFLRISAGNWDIRLGIDMLWVDGEDERC